MRRLDRILAVIDPTADVQPAAIKAARLARASGATLELYICDYDPALSGRPFADTEALHTLREEFLAERLEYLEDLAEELRAGGLTVETHVHWDNPLYRGILRRIDETAPDLVVKDTHYHSLLRRTLLTNTDWNLVRECPVPLWLARSGEWSARPRVLAAIDPEHQGDQPAALDHEILETASLAARLVEGDLEAVHAFLPAALLALTTGMGGLPLGGDTATDQIVATERKRVEGAVLELAAAHGLAAGSVRLVQGSAAEALPRVVSDTGADLVVMGAVSRSRLEELFVGSTAERILDRLPADVLVVKPPVIPGRAPA